MTVGKTGSRRLRGSRLLEGAYGVEEDPMASMGNLMDVMLVFACGLMIALIARYNVDFTPTDPQTGTVQKLEEDLEAIEQGSLNSDSSFAEVGTVYRDVETGELYVVEPDE